MNIMVEWFCGKGIGWISCELECTIGYALDWIECVWNFCMKLIFEMWLGLVGKGMHCNGSKWTWSKSGLKIQLWMKITLFKIGHGFKWNRLKWLMDNMNKVKVIEGWNYGKLTLVN